MSKSTQGVGSVVTGNLVLLQAEKEAMSAALQGYPEQLMDFVCDARENASFNEHQMKLIDGYEAQEVYLMQRFLWATLSGVR